MNVLPQESSFPQYLNYCQKQYEYVGLKKYEVVVALSRIVSFLMVATITRHKPAAALV